VGSSFAGSSPMLADKGSMGGDRTLFSHGRSPVVRLPMEFRLPGDRVRGRNQPPPPVGEEIFE